MINWEIIFISGISSTICMLLGLFVFLKNRHDKVNFYFFLICGTSVIWTLSDSVGQYIVHFSRDYGLFISRFAQIGGVFMGLSHIFLIDHLLRRGNISIYEKFFRYLIFTSSIIVFFLSPTDLIILEVNKNATPIEVPGKYYNIFTIYLIVGICYSVVRLYNGMRNPMVQNRKKIQYIFISLLMGFIGMISVLIITNYSSNLAKIVYFIIPYLFLLMFCSIVAYAIVKHQLLDIEIVIGKGLARVITYVLYTLLFLGIHEGLNLIVNNYFQNSFLLLTVSFLFAVLLPIIHPKLKSKIQSVPDYFLLRHRLNYLEITSEILKNSEKVLSIKDFLFQLKDCLGKKANLSNISLYLRGDFAEELMSEFHWNNYYIVNEEGLLSPFSAFDESDPFLNKIKKMKVFYEHESSTDREKRAFQSTGSKVCIPFIKENDMYGFMFLGYKENDMEFSSDEIVLFDFLLPQFSIATYRMHLHSLTVVLERTQMGLLESQRDLTYFNLIQEYVHEIKTPLSVLKNKVDLEFVNNAKAKEILQVQFDRIFELLDMILKMGRRERKIDLRILDINKVIESVTVFFPDLGKRDLRLGFVPKIQGDYRELQILFTNLLKNSLEAMSHLEEKDRIVQIETSYIPSTKEILITIADKGVGIPEEKLDRIWERVESNKILEGGTGIGMMIIKRIVKKHKGSIVVESTVGEGSIFMIRLPLAHEESMGDDELI